MIREDASSGSVWRRDRRRRFQAVPGKWQDQAFL